MDYFQQQLRTLADHPIVGEVRGLGMFAALELVKDKSSRERLAPESAGAVYCRDQAIGNGLMVRAVGDAMVSAPPLICNREEIDTLVDRLNRALDATAGHYGLK
jgi:putrescine aminotransferase